MPRPYGEYEGTRLWRALEGAVRELEATGEVKLATAPDYVIGYLCQELAARGVVHDGGLAGRPGGRPKAAGSASDDDDDPTGG